MSNMMELGIWDECGCSNSNYMKIRRVLPCLAVVLLDSGAHALVGLDGGDELQEISHVFTESPELEPLLEEVDASDEQMDRWEEWFEIADKQMELLSNSFNLAESFEILSDSLDVGFTMDEQFKFWFYNRIAAAVELMKDDPVRGRYEYPTTPEQLEESVTLDELSEMRGTAEELESSDAMFIAPEDEDGKRNLA